MAMSENEMIYVKCDDDKAIKTLIYVLDYSLNTPLAIAYRVKKKKRRKNNPSEKLKTIAAAVYFLLEIFLSSSTIFSFEPNKFGIRACFRNTSPLYTICPHGLKHGLLICLLSKLIPDL